MNVSYSEARWQIPMHVGLQQVHWYRLNVEKQDLTWPEAEEAETEALRSEMRARFGLD